MRRIWRQCAGCCEKDGTEMKRFQFGLDTVLQYKRQVLDGAQNEYAEASSGSGSRSGGCGKRRRATGA